MILPATITAEVAALSRALGARDPRLPHRCGDDLADIVLHPIGRLILSRALLRIEARRLIERVTPGLYTWHTLRTAYFDAQLQKALRAGVSQVVILGAGLDTRAARLCTSANRVKVFEMDQSPLGARKMRSLGRATRATPSHHRLVRTDLSGRRPRLKALLSEHGYDAREDTFVLCEGLLMYFPLSIVKGLLTELRELSPGLRLAFDYVHDDALRTAEHSDGAQVVRSAAVVKAPYLSGFDPATLAPELAQLGFHLEEQLDGQALAEQAWGARRPPYVITSCSSVVTARG